MTTEKNIVIEQHKRFSKSTLWRIQKDYFDRAGVSAWVNQVPFYITCNPFIAKSYARIFLGFMRDWMAKHPETRQHPFYILEIGAGSGRFTFYFVTALHQMMQQAGMHDVRVCHVMSDFTRSNMQYWEKHHAIQPLVEKGWVEFAIYDMEAERPITLVQSKTHLDHTTLINPLTVIGNYIFDTSLNDLFGVREEALYELTTSLETPQDNMDGNTPIEMEKVKVHYDAKKVASEFYGDPLIDNILEKYRSELQDTVFLLPIGAFHALGFLRKLANNRLLLLSTDKGNGALHTLDGATTPPIYFHGCFFSAMVNFHAIGEYMQNAGGEYCLQTPRKGIKTAVFSCGFGLSDMGETQRALSDWVEGMSPADYFTLHRRMSDTFNECQLDTIAAHMQLAGWDPHIYMKLASRVRTLIKDTDRDTLNFMTAGMHQLAANFYDMPKTDCVLFEVGLFFHTLKNYAEAAKYYTQARHFMPENYSLSYNLGLCLHYLDNDTAALTHFRYALALNPDAKEVQEWITHIEQEKDALPLMKEE